VDAVRATYKYANLRACGKMCTDFSGRFAVSMEQVLKSEIFVVERRRHASKRLGLI